MNLNRGSSAWMYKTNKQREIDLFSLDYDPSQIDL